MDFLTELRDLRQQRLAEIADASNQKCLNDFMAHLLEILKSQKAEVHNGFRFYVKNNPKFETPAITRKYEIDNKYSHGKY